MAATGKPTSSAASTKLSNHAGKAIADSNAPATCKSSQLTMAYTPETRMTFLRFSSLKKDKIEAHG